MLASLYLAHSPVFARRIVAYLHILMIYETITNKCWLGGTVIPMQVHSSCVKSIQAPIKELLVLVSKGFGEYQIGVDGVGFQR